MFERFTDRARRVVVLAQEEARMLNHNYIGTEHILLGILREGENVGAQALVRMGADVNRVRPEVIRLVAPAAEAEAVSRGQGPGPPGESRNPPGETRMERIAVSYDYLLTEVRNSLAAMADRLTAIERHLGMTAGTEQAGGSPGGKPAEGQAGEPDAPPGAGPSGEPDDPPGDVSPAGG